MVSPGPSGSSKLQGRFILGAASHLDAFSGYLRLPSLPGAAVGTTAGTREASSSRFDVSVSPSGSLLLLHSLRASTDRTEGTMRAPPLLFRRRPPQSNCPPATVPRRVCLALVSTSHGAGWYFTVVSP